MMAAAAAPDFEALLWDLFLRLLDVPGERVEAEILEAQRRFCRALDLDRSALWQVTPDAARRLVVTHFYDVQQDGATERVGPDGSVVRGEERHFLLSGGSSIAKHADASGPFPWVTQHVLSGKTLVLSVLDDLPPEAAQDRASFKRFGTRSTVIVPLRAQDDVLGCLTFASARRSREWPGELVARFERLAHVFAKAIAKKRADDLLRDREARLELAAASAEAGLWELDIATGRLQTTEVTKRLFGLAPEDEFDIHNALAAVHPEDRHIVIDDIAKARDHRVGFSHEYRLLMPDGSVRWVYSRGRPFPTAHGEPGDRILGASIEITERKRTEEQLRTALEDLKQLQDRLHHENMYLRDEIKERRNPAQIIGTSASIRRTLELVDQVAPTSATVLLTGETGTGKERIAAAIHELSQRRARAMVKVNCAAMPSTLIESEMFGREKGAYTGALTRQIGRFELANGSTIFLDEIGDLPIETQTKLLRVIETREFERLGSPSPVHVDVRIIAATNRDLEQAVRDGRFREDLYFRLNVFPIALPPLRERIEDIPLLVKALVDELSVSMGKPFDAIARTSLQALQRYHWPGNIRELRNVIERAIIGCDGSVLHIEAPVFSSRGLGANPKSLKALERDHVLAVLEQTGWRIRGPRGAAVILGLQPTTLENRMKRLGIRRPGNPLP